MVTPIDHFRLVPGSPSFHLRTGSSALAGHELFSYARHAMIEFLAFLRRRKGFGKINLLSPLYMCHEVITTLRQHTDTVTFFPQREDFSFDPLQIREQCQREDINVLLISHLYGKRLAVEPLRQLCDDLGIVLLEDSAHLPWFVLEDTPQYSHARFFTYRKLFALPYGASIKVCAEWQNEFSSYCRTDVAWKNEPLATLAFARWLARESAKSMIKSSGMTWRRSYTELGIDPLKEFNRAPGSLAFCLRHLQGSHYVVNRKKNYSLLRSEFSSDYPEWNFLDCSDEQDVPYQFLLYRKEQIDAESILGEFLHRGISAVKGLELLPETRAQLGINHPFNNQIGLPVQQDLTFAEVDHLLETCRKVLN